MEKKNRYVMSWSQADRQDMVVYADSYEDANRLFEDGLYVLEDHVSKSIPYVIWDIDWDIDEGDSAELPLQVDMNLDPDDEDILYVIENNLSDYYGYCVNSFSFRKKEVAL